MNDPTNNRYRYISFQNGEYRRYKQDDTMRSTSLFFSVPPSEIVAHGSYGSLLLDRRWRARRLQILERDNHACVICQNKANLQVHHRQYHFKVRENKFRYPWDYDDWLMITLCESCHKRGHSKFKVPTIKI